MWRERIVWLVLALAIGAGGFYYGRQNGIAIGQSNVQQAAARFASDRGGAAGDQAGHAGANGANGAANEPRGQNVFGTVDSVDGTTITVKTRTGTTSKIQLAANGKVRKQADGQISDIKPGDTVVANGAMSGDVLQATTIQIGGGFGGQRGGGQGQ